MRDVKLGFCLSLLFILVVFTSEGASPLETQTARIGPYQLLLNFYSLPRVGQQLNMTIGPETPHVSLQFSQGLFKPGPSTDANVVRVAISPSTDTRNFYNVSITPPVRGAWLLTLTVSGPKGSFTGNIPINVQGTPIIPIWLGWMIGMIPLSFIIVFIWSQVRRRSTRLRGRVRQEML